MPGLGRGPLVDLGGRGPDGHDLAVVGDEPCGIRHLDDEGGALGRDVELVLRDPEVAHRDPACPQHPGRLGAPHRCELVDLGEQLAGRATSSGVDERGGLGLELRRLELGPAVQAAATEHEPDLAGQRHAIDRHRQQQVVLDEPTGRQAPGLAGGQHAERRPPRHLLEHRPRIGWCLVDRRPELVGARHAGGEVGAQLVHRRAQARDRRAEDLGHGAHDVLAVGAAPDEGGPPQVGEVRGDDRLVGTVEQRGELGDRGAVTRDDEGLEHLQVPAVECFDGPLHAGPRARPGSEAREVGRRRTREVGAREHEVDELRVGACADVVGQASARGGHPPNLVAWGPVPRAGMAPGPPLERQRPIRWAP